MVHIGIYSMKWYAEIKLIFNSCKNKLKMRFKLLVQTLPKTAQVLFELLQILTECFKFITWIEKWQTLTFERLDLVQKRKLTFRSPVHPICKTTRSFVVLNWRWIGRIRFVFRFSPCKCCHCFASQLDSKWSLWFKWKVKRKQVFELHGKVKSKPYLKQYRSSFFWADWQYFNESARHCSTWILAHSWHLGTNKNQ